jgi:hypothetical protein
VTYQHSHQLNIFYADFKVAGDSPNISFYRGDQFVTHVALSLRLSGDGCCHDDAEEMRVLTPDELRCGFRATRVSDPLHDARNFEHQRPGL